MFCSASTIAFLIRSAGTIWCWNLLYSHIQLISISYFFSLDSSWVNVNLHNSINTFWQLRKEPIWQSSLRNQIFRTEPWLFACLYLQCNTNIRSIVRTVLACKDQILHQQYMKRQFRRNQRDEQSCRECRRWGREIVYQQVFFQK